MTLTGNEWQKPLIVTGPDSMHPWQRLRRGCFKDPKGWAFCIAVLQMEEIRQVYSLPSLSEDPCVVESLKAEEQQVPIATTTVHQWQYLTKYDPIHKLIH